MDPEHARDERLVAAAREARERAHAPYSGFRVGAALLTADGATVTGCNVENASYGLTLCAERVAAARAVAEGRTGFVALAIVAEGESPVAPCGACRQFLHELAPELRIVCATLDGRSRVARLAELLPDAFGAESLGADAERPGR